MCVTLEGDHKTYIFFKNLNTFARFIFGFIIFRTLFLKLSSLNIYIFHQLFSCCFILKTLHLAFLRDYSFGSAKVLGAVFLIIVYKSTASYVYKLQVSLEVRFCDCGCVHASENIDLKLHFMLFDKMHYFYHDGIQCVHQIDKLISPVQIRNKDYNICIFLCTCFCNNKMVL